MAVVIALVAMAAVVVALVGVEVATTGPRMVEAKTRKRRGSRRPTAATTIAPTRSPERKPREFTLAPGKMPAGGETRMPTLRPTNASVVTRSPTAPRTKSPTQLPFLSFCMKITTQKKCAKQATTCLWDYLGIRCVPTCAHFRLADQCLLALNAPLYLDCVWNGRSCVPKKTG